MAAVMALSACSKAYPGPRVAVSICDVELLAGPMQPLVHTVTYSRAPAGHGVPPTNVPHVAHNVTAPLSAAAGETSYVRVAPGCVHGAAVRLDPLTDARVTGIVHTTDGK